jgi:hypothetical protein
VIRLRLEMYPKAAAWIERPFTLRSKRSGLGSRFDLMTAAEPCSLRRRGEHSLVNKYIGSSKASQSVRVYRRQTARAYFEA